MRALRVVGLGEDGKSVICEDPARGERFELPADERLRAAARGDATRLGQIETDLESQMRPREIQSRIRSGESVEQVAAAAGVPEHRIERFAYPVLLERSRIADLAQRAHPVREDGPDVQTLGEVVAHSFGLRGQDYSDTSWDAWKGDDGKWVVQLHWRAGRSDNSAHWSFHPGAHGGTVSALDEHSMDLLDPNPNRQLRTVRPVTELARQALTVDNDNDTRRQAVGAVEPVRPEQSYQPPAPPEPTYREPAYREPPVYREPAYREPVTRQPEPEPAVGLTEQPVEPEPRPAVTAPPPVTQPAQPAQPAATAPVAPTPPVAQPAAPEPAAEPVAPEPAAVAPEPAAPEPAAAPEPEQPPAVAPEPVEGPAATVEEPKPEPQPEPKAEPQAEIKAEPKPEPKAETKPEPEAEQKPEPKAEAKPEPQAEAPPETKPKPPARRKGKKNHPVVPSWEDVLLGTRSHRG